ncbi:MAG: hypothetical protein IPO78_17510 [Saprospiraceae bacterium]|nr:hypothetical protein [Saprospiraceae bacterium]
MIRLIYNNPAPDNVWINPLWIDQDGRISLDTGVEFGIALTKEVQKLTDINQITVETILDTALPATAKNFALLGISMDVEVIDNEYPEHDVVLEIGVGSLPHEKLKVIGYSRTANEIEVQLIHSSNYWIEGIKNTYLDELPFGEFTYNDQEILENFDFNSYYNDGDPGYYFGHVFYGLYPRKIGGKPVLTPECFRPLVHTLKVMQLGFAANGWDFVCPILETDTGRRLVNYVNAENWNNTDADLERLKFKAAIEGTHTFKRLGSNVIEKGTTLAKTNGDQKLRFNKEIIDNGDNYDASTGTFTKSGVFDFICELDLHISIGQAGATQGESLVKFRLVHEYYDGTITDIGDVFEIRTTLHTDYHDRHTIIVEDETMNIGDDIYLYYYIGGKNIGYVFMTNGSVFYNKPKRNLLSIGDTIDIGANLRHDTVLDFAKGVSHLFNLHYYTDYTTLTVYALTPYDIEFFGDNIEGFYGSSLTDYKTKMIVDSEKYQQIEKTLKNRVYSFKKSTDAKILSLKYSEHQPFAKIIDNGFDLKDSEKNEKFENPYFEPTINADTGLDFFGGTLEAPYMVDNLDGRLSWNIQPRILIAAGMETLYFKSNKSGNWLPDFIKYLLFYNDNMVSKIPHCYQLCNQALSYTGVFPDFVYEIPDRKLVYGTYADDLFEIIYKKYDLFLRDNPVIQFKARLNSEDYYSENFRNRVRIYSPNIHNGDLFGRVTKVSGYEPETGLAELSFIADKQTIDECIGFEVPLSCNNFPVINVSKVGTVHTFSLGGQIESTVDTELWEYRPVGRSWWSTGNVVTTPTQNTEVKLTLTFTSGCPKITLDYLIVVRLEPKITLTRTGNKVTAQEVGTHELTVSDTKIYYSEDNLNWKLYEAEIDLDNITVDNLYWRVDVTYSDGQERSYSTVISTQPEENDCPNPDAQQYPPTVIVSKDANSYWFYKSGDYSGCAVYDQILYREKNKNQEFVIYNNEIISLQKCWEIQRRIIWCKEGCPPYCSPSVYTDCGACVSKATLNTSQSSATCTHEQKYENPDVPASLTWKVEPLDNKVYHMPTIRTWIEQNAGAAVEINESTVIWDRWNFRTEYIYTWNTGYKIKNINVTSADTLGIGSQYTLLLDVLYSSGDTNDELIDAIRSAITQQLAIEDFTDLTHYELYVSVTGSSSKTLNIGFLAKHNPVDTWIGINKGTDLMAIEAPDTTITGISATGKEYQQVTTSQPVLSNISPYGTSFKIRFKVSTVDYFLDDSSSNFNLLVANASTPILTDTLSTGLTDTGKKYTLGSSFTGCPGSSIWQWLFGGAKKGEPGIVISRTDAATVFIQANTEVICYGTCQSTGYCGQEKRILLTI